MKKVIWNISQDTIKVIDGNLPFSVSGDTLIGDLQQNNIIFNSNTEVPANLDYFVRLWNNLYPKNMITRDQVQTTDPLQVTSARKYNGVIITVEPRDDEREKLVIKDGEPTTALHITMAYIVQDINDLKEGRLDEVKAKLKKIAKNHEPVSGKITSTAIFDEGEEPAQVLLVNAPGLGLLRSELVQELGEIEDKHDFIPHITIKYGIDEPEDFANKQEVHFDDLVLRVADIPTKFPLGKTSDVEKRANILDPIHNTLDQDVFNGETPRMEFFDYHLHHVRETFRQYGFNPHGFEFYLTGSLCTYQYSQYSDVDISIVPKYDLSEEDRSDLIRVVVHQLDGEFFPRTTHRYQHFVQPEGVNIHDLFSLGLKGSWDFQKKDWLLKPTRVPKHDVYSEKPDWILTAVQFSDKVNSLIDSSYYKEAMEMYRSLHEKRKEDQKIYGDYSEGNIIYKFLNNNGTFDRLRNVGVKIAGVVSRKKYEGMYTHLNSKGKPCKCGFGRVDLKVVKKYNNNDFKEEFPILSSFKNSWQVVAATKEEVIDLIANTDFKEGSKWNKKYPGFREIFLTLLRDAPEESKFAFRWAAAAFKKEVPSLLQRVKDITATRQALQEESFGPYDIDLLKELESKLLQIYHSTVEEEMENSPQDLKNVFSILDIPIEEVTNINNSNSNFYRNHRLQKRYGNLVANFIRSCIEYQKYSNENETIFEDNNVTTTLLKRFVNNLRDIHSYVSEEDMVESITQQELSSLKDDVGVSRALSNLAEIKPLIDRYNISFDLNQIVSFRELLIEIGNIRKQVIEREEYRKSVEDFKNSNGWDSDPVAKFPGKGGMWGIYPVATIGDAYLEGHLMNNCIGSDEYHHFHGICQFENNKGESGIRAYSVRDPQGIPWATITLSADGSNVYEARGRKNQKIRPQEQEMLSKFFEDEFGEDHEYLEKEEGERSGEYNYTPNFRPEEEEEREPYPREVPHPIEEEVGDIPQPTDIEELEEIVGWLREVVHGGFSHYLNGGLFEGQIDDEIHTDDDGNPYYLSYGTMYWPDPHMTLLAKNLKQKVKEINLSSKEERIDFFYLILGFCGAVGLLKQLIWNSNLTVNSFLKIEEDDGFSNNFLYLKNILDEVGSLELSEIGELTDSDISDIDEDASGNLNYTYPQEIQPSLEYHPTQTQLTPENWQAIIDEANKRGKRNFDFEQEPSSLSMLHPELHDLLNYFANKTNDKQDLAHINLIKATNPRTFDQYYPTWIEKTKQQQYWAQKRQLQDISFLQKQPLFQENPYLLEKGPTTYPWIDSEGMGIEGIPRAAKWNNMKYAGIEDLSDKILSLVRENPAARIATEMLSPFGDVFVVGGAARDVVLNKKPKDLDLMAKIPGEVIEQVLGTIPKSSLVLTGKQFPVYRFKHQGEEVEIALPRIEVKTGEGNKDWSIQSDHRIPVEKDLERRDFTSNAIAVNAATGEVHDPFNGIQDIQAGKVRTVTPTSFRDDSSRTMRALTQVSKHGLQPDQETVNQMREFAPHLIATPFETIGQEFEKIISGKHPHEAIKLGHHAGVLEHFLPEVHNAFDFDQKNPFHKYDLGTHLLHVLRHTADQTDDPDVRIAALLHDIGKPRSMWVDDNGIGHFYRNEKGEGANHEEVGAQMSEDVLRRLRFPTDRIARISNLVHNHMFPSFNTGKGARKLLNRSGSEQAARDLLTLRQADHIGKGNEDATYLMVDKMRNILDQELSSNAAFNPKSLAVGGNDIIKILGINPGPVVGQILKELMEIVIDNPKLNNKGDLYSIIRRLGQNG